MQLTEVTQQIPALTSRAGISALAQKAYTDIAAGNTNPLQAALQVKALEEFAKEMRGLMEPDVTAALARYEKGTFSQDGAKLEIAEVGISYDYSGCPKWAALKAQEEALATARKERETFLKTLSRPIVETDMETGESIELFPPVKTSKTSFKATLTK